MARRNSATLLLVLALWATAVGDDSLQWSDWYDSDSDNYWFEYSGYGNDKPMIHVKSLDDLLYDDWRDGKISYREYLDRRLHPEVISCTLMVWLSGRRIIPPYTPTELLEALHVYRHLVDWWPTAFETREIHYPSLEHSSHVIIGYRREYCTDTTCAWREVRP